MANNELRALYISSRMSVGDFVCNHSPSFLGDHPDSLFSDSEASDADISDWETTDNETSDGYTSDNDTDASSNLSYIDSPETDTSSETEAEIKTEKPECLNAIPNQIHKDQSTSMRNRQVSLAHLSLFPHNPSPTLEFHTNNPQITRAIKYTIFAAIEALCLLAIRSGGKVPHWQVPTIRFQLQYDLFWSYSNL